MSALQAPGRSSGCRRFQPQRFVAAGITVTLLLAGCSTYREQPLSQAAVAARLAPPDAVTLRMQARDFQHPRLPPLVISPGADLDPDQLAVVAVLVNPGLRALRDERAVAAAQVIQAGILPNPQLSVGTDLTVHGPDGSETRGHGVGLGWEVTSLIARGAHQSAASAHADAVDLDIAWQEWQVAATARAAAVRLIGAEQRLALAEESERVLVGHSAALRQAGADGLVTRLDEAVATTATNDARAAVLDLRQECMAQRLLLTRVLGFPPDRHVSVRLAAWPTRLTIPADLAAGLEAQRLDLLALRRGYDSQDATVRAAILGQFPKISLGLNQARDTGGVTTLNLGISIDLPLFDRNQGVIASEEATRQRLFDEYALRLFEARHDLAAASAEAEATAARIVQQDAAVALLSADATALTDALAAGRIDALTTQIAISQVAQKRMEALASRQHLAELRIAIELAAGRLLAMPVMSADSERRGER